MSAPGRPCIALSALLLTLLLPAAPAAAQDEIPDPGARAVVDDLKQNADVPPLAPARPVSVVEAAYRDDDGDILMLLSDGPLWVRRKQPFRLEPYSGGVVSHPAPGRERFDFVDPRLPGQLGTLRIEPGAATAACGAKTEALKPLAAAEIADIVSFMDSDKVMRPHYGMPKRLLESPGRELAFLTLGDDDSLERRLFRIDCDGDKCAVKEHDSRGIPGDAGVDTLQVLEKRGGPIAGTLIDARDSGKASTWTEALTGSGMPLKAVAATWAELEKLGVKQRDVLGSLSTPCDCALDGRAAN